MDELFEFRQALEIQCAMAAAERRTEEDLLRIEEVWVLGEHFIKIGRDPTSPTTDFHFAIAKATHNSVMMRIYDFLFDLHIFAARTNLHTTGRLLEAHAEHRRIFESIRDRDPEAAGRHMRLHMENSRRTAHALAVDHEGISQPDSTEGGEYSERI